MALRAEAGGLVRLVEVPALSPARQECGPRSTPERNPRPLPRVTLTTSILSALRDSVLWPSNFLQHFPWDQLFTEAINLFFQMQTSLIWFDTDLQHVVSGSWGWGFKVPR